jgi:chemotaxis protein MotB
MLAFPTWPWRTASAVICVLLGGCLAPQSQVAQFRVQNQNLAEQSRAQLAEIESLRAHCRETENQLQKAEEELALVNRRLGLDDQQLAGYQNERELLRKDYMDAVAGRSWVSPEARQSLATLAHRCPELQFDERSGIAKLRSDILFESGKAELKPGAEEMLRKVAWALGEPEAADLRVMVVGHTDDRGMVRRSGQESYNSNFDLSAARATIVANRLRGLGLKSERIGLAGYGAHEPLVANTSAAERYKNRRVEIFVVAPDVPVVGWTETTPTVY